MEKKDIVQKIKNGISCKAIIVAREEHKQEGHHWNMGILNDGMKSDNAPQVLIKCCLGKNPLSTSYLESEVQL